MTQVPEIRPDVDSIRDTLELVRKLRDADRVIPWLEHATSDEADAANADRLSRADPGWWDQGSWRCQTGMCIAGHGAEHAGYRWVTNASHMFRSDNVFVSDAEYVELLRWHEANRGRPYIVQAMSVQSLAVPGHWQVPVKYVMWWRWQLSHEQMMNLFACNTTVERVEELLAEWE